MTNKRTGDNNGGFSLIELVITIMVMAILMVAIVPQVTKWVDNARISTDNQLRNSLVTYAQLSLTDSQAYAAASEEVIYIVANNTGCTIEGTMSHSIDAFASTFADYASTTATAISPGTLYKLADGRIKTKTSGGVITVLVSFGTVSSGINGALESEDLGISASDFVFGGVEGQNDVISIPTGGGSGAGGIIGTILETALGDDGNTHTFSQRGSFDYLDNKPLYDSTDELVSITGNPRSRVYVRRNESDGEYYDMYQWNRLNGDNNEWSKVEGKTIKIAP